jgi:hypothetical protein
MRGIYMSYIRCVKELLSDYKKDWDIKKLKDPFEREQFYDLLDEMVLEARHRRSSWLSKMAVKYGLNPNIVPENFLLQLFEREINKVTKKFIDNHSDLKTLHEDEIQDREKEYQETTTFKEWSHYARIFVKNEILGDAANRADRKLETGYFLESPGDDMDRHLTLVNRRLKSKRDKTLGLGKDESIDDIPRRNPLIYSDSDDLWKDISEGKDAGSKHFRFLILDSAAVKVAESIARKEGIGYNPDWHTSEEREFISKLNGVYYSLVGWDEDHCNTIDQKIAFIKRIIKKTSLQEKKRMETEIQMSIGGLCSQLKQLSRTNLCAYLFGERARRIRTRLDDFYKLLNKRPGYLEDAPIFYRYYTEGIDADEENDIGYQELERHRNIIDPNTAKDQLNKIQLKEIFKEMEKFLTENQIKILHSMIQFKQNQSAVAQELGFSKSYINQEWRKMCKKLSNNPHLIDLVSDVL